MRKFLVYLIIFVFAIGLGYWAQQLKPSEDPLVLTIDTDYVIAYQEDGIFDVIMFTNAPSHPLFKKDHVLRVIMKDETKDMFFELNLSNLSLGSQEMYLHQIWTRMIFSFSIPYFSEDVMIEDASLSIELFDEQNYQVRLGQFYLYSGYQEIDWTHLSGQKQSQVLLSRLGTIYIGLSNDAYHVSKVSLGGLDDSTFDHQNDELIIHIPNEAYLLFDPAILITFEDGSVGLIPNFLYIIDHMLLKESGPLINHYALY